MPALSGRQLQIVRLITTGQTGPEIAAQLGLSHHIVRAHMNNAKSKCGVRSRPQRVAAALPALEGVQENGGPNARWGGAARREQWCGPRSFMSREPPDAAGAD